MPSSSKPSPTTRLASPSGLAFEINANGSLRRIDCGDTMLNLFLGNAAEGGPANLYLRSRSDTPRTTELLGPRSPTRFERAGDRMLLGSGTWQSLDYRIALVLAADAPAWFWHVSLTNGSTAAHEVDLIYAQDIALAPYGTVRLNEYYVSQYVDHTPLAHVAHGTAVASRQNLAAGGRNPWCLIGSLRSGAAFATDALQVHGLASRAGTAPAGIVGGLPGQRLQHEHSMVAIQDAPLRLAPGETAALGFYGWFLPDHAAATSAADLACVDQVLALPEAKPPVFAPAEAGKRAAATLFATAPLLTALDLDADALHALYPGAWRHVEHDAQGGVLSFFHADDRHVVLRAKELAQLRPHGHLLRSGAHLTPDESALTSTVWMAGVFHSMLTQGHVSFNRLLSTAHSYLGLFRSHGQRVFVELEGAWHLLDVPSAFEMAPGFCRWIYRHAGGTLTVRSEAHDDPHAMSLSIESSGAAVRLLICHHVALNGDDGSTPGPARWQQIAEGVTIAPAPRSELARRFARGDFLVAPAPGTRFERVGGDELLYSDERSRREPYVCIVTAPSASVGLRLHGRLIESTDAPAPLHAQAALLRITPPAGSALAAPLAQLADIVPWYTHNALVHYLSPRGLEQYSGGGWGTRDVCQGPVEMLLARGQTAPVRDLLLRVMRAQNPDGDWPQWFMFFERERAIRAGDSHGDIVYWPVLALAQYLIASGDAAILEERVPYFRRRISRLAVPPTVWQHVKRALALAERRVVAGTKLAAYGHGDWNDALQPADPALREHMCSAWTVTLHYQTLTTLARALRTIGRGTEAARFASKAKAVQRDFERLLLVDGVIAGYALFDAAGGSANVRYLLHPRDATTGVRYSALAMIHAIIEGMLSPAQARAHLQLIDEHLLGPDGVRLFDRPLPYHGGPQRIFQRAESATFFGREIGLMYMHAHLRYAQALAHMGEAERFFRALCQANPIGLRELVPQSSLRQANCYTSSSDAAFADRAEASAEYARVAQGSVALDGGWRVYSSGAGIALGLIVRRFLGLSTEADALGIDPVMPPALDGLQVETTLFGRALQLRYRVQGTGCGVGALRLNGAPLAFTHEANPYRIGAARVAKSVFAKQLAEGVNTLEISVGQAPAAA